MPKFPKNKSAFMLKSGNTTPFKQMGAGQYTKSLQRRAFGTGVNPRDGAKMLNTSTWNYNKMKKNYERRLTKDQITYNKRVDRIKSHVKENVTTEVKTETNPYKGAHAFSHGGVVWRKNPKTQTGFEYTFTSLENLGKTDDEVWYDDSDEFTPEYRIGGSTDDPSYDATDLERIFSESLNIKE